MTPATESLPTRGWALAPTVAGALSATLGLVVLVGWYTHTEILIQVMPTWVPMQYNTALGFLLSGIGLVALTLGRWRTVVALASVVGAVGLLTLTQYVFGVQLGIDQLFFEHYIFVETSHPGRMAPSTALAFSLTAAALLAVTRGGPTRPSFWLVGLLGLIPLSLGTVALIGYVVGAQTAYGWGQLTRMAVHTSTGFVVLASGLLAYTFRRGLTPVATSGPGAPLDPRRARRSIVVTSIGIMALVSMAVGTTVLRELYSAGLDAQRDRLTELVQSRARMIEAVARFDERYSQDAVPGGASAATLGQVVEASEGSTGFGRTGEFTLARREGGEIVFIVRPPRAGPGFAERVSMGSPRAEPMQRALEGQSGTLIGIDYSGERVVAAYAPLPSLDLGIVAKMDLTEIRAPFVRSAWVAIVIAFMFIAIGAGATMVGVDPLARRVERQARELHATNLELTHEVTERRRAEEHIRQVNISLEHRVAERTLELTAATEEMEAFAYSVSHDLKAPLRAIDGYSGMLEESHGSALTEEGLRLLGVVRENTQHMARLIDDLLAFSHIGRAELVVSPVDMEELARSVFSDLVRLEDDRTVEFSLGELPTVMGDLALLRQVWANLIGNAVKFTGGRAVARIEVDCEAEPAHWVFRVRDNGAGFDMEYVDKLFGVFQRLHYQEEFPGTGVGLATVQRIVQRHGGEVWAEGRVDVGATLFFRLSRSEEAT